MKTPIEELWEYMEHYNNEWFASSLEATYNKTGLNKIINDERNKIEKNQKKSFDVYIAELQKKGQLRIYAQELLHKHIPDIADRIPESLRIPSLEFEAA